MQTAEYLAIGAAILVVAGMGTLYAAASVPSSSPAVTAPITDEAPDLRPWFLRLIDQRGWRCGGMLAADELTSARKDARNFRVKCFEKTANGGAMRAYIITIGANAIRHLELGIWAKPGDVAFIDPVPFAYMD